MIQIIPAILAKTSEDCQADIEKLNQSESFREGWVHIDFADNDFVPNITIDAQEAGEIETSLKKEAHLMVSHPLDWIEKIKKAGFEQVIFHFESKDSAQEVIKVVKQAGMEVGIAIKAETDIEFLTPFKDKIDQILVMGIVAGFQGQPFIPATIDRIKDLKSRKWPLKISVDGSVRDTNAKDLVEAGADQLVIGSFLLKGDIDENAEKIWEAISS